MQWYHVKKQAIAWVHGRCLRHETTPRSAAQRRQHTSAAKLQAFFSRLSSRPPRLHRLAHPRWPLPLGGREVRSLMIDDDVAPSGWLARVGPSAGFCAVQYHFSGPCRKEKHRSNPEGPREYFVNQPKQINHVWTWQRWKGTRKGWRQASPQSPP